MSTKSPLDVVGDPTRRAIMDRLHGGPASVGEIAAGLPISRPAVSQHLAVLKASGLVGARRVGTRRIYRLDVDGLEPMRAWIESLSAPLARPAAAPAASAASAAPAASAASAASAMSAAGPAQSAPGATPVADGAPTVGPAKDRKKHKKHGKK